MGRLYAMGAPQARIHSLSTHANLPIILYGICTMCISIYIKYVIFDVCMHLYSYSWPSWTPSHFNKNHSLFLCSCYWQASRSLPSTRRLRYLLRPKQTGRDMGCCQLLAWGQVSKNPLISPFCWHMSPNILYVAYFQYQPKQIRITDKQSNVVNPRINHNRGLVLGIHNPVWIWDGVNIYVKMTPQMVGQWDSIGFATLLGFCFCFSLSGPGLRVPGIFLWTSMGLDCDAVNWCAYCPIWHILGKPKAREARCNGFVDTKRVLVPLQERYITWNTFIWLFLYVWMGKHVSIDSSIYENYHHPRSTQTS